MRRKFPTVPHLASLAVGCALALGAASSAPAASFMQFGSQFTGITTNNLTPSQTFDVDFTGSLGLSGNANSMYLGALLDGMFVGNPHNYSFGSFDGQIDFVGGDIVGGFLSFSVNSPTANGGFYTDSFTANFAATDTSISQDPLHNQFSITGGLTGIELTSGSGSTWAGFDVSNFLNFGGNMVGSLFAFTYDGSISDSTTGMIATAVIPLPGAVWMGLAGLAGLGVLRRRRANA